METTTTRLWFALPTNPAYTLLMRNLQLTKDQIARQKLIKRAENILSYSTKQTLLPEELVALVAQVSEQTREETRSETYGTCHVCSRVDCFDRFAVGPGDQGDGAEHEFCFRRPVFY